MSSTPQSPAAKGSQSSGIPRVLVATTALLSFISFWRAAAIVLNDLASSAYYAGGEAEGYIGKAAPWFILGIMLFSYAVRAIYVESCSMFVRGGVYRVVKEALGGTLAKFSVSALMFDYILTGPISGVSAGQYIVGLFNETADYIHLGFHVAPNFGAAFFAILCTLYFWWYNIKGVQESSQKAMRIMQVTTVMVVILISWCVYTALLRHSALPPFPTPHNLKLEPNAMGWLYGVKFAHFAALIAIFVGLGHSVLAMSGEESLAQVYREIEHPKLPNLKKTGLVIFVYSLVFTSLVSFFAVMLIPDAQRQNFLENLIGGLAMNLEGPFILRLIFHGFVVVVGTLILAGAVNTAIVGSNGVLNRVSEDGVLADWFRQPHRRFGTTYRIIWIIAGLQILTIIISRGDVTFLANLYAFGVIWSFAMKGLAVLVLRYTHPGDREYRVPLNFRVFGVEIPLGLSLITLVLLGIAVINLFTKKEATIAGVTFSIFLFIVFTISEKFTHHARGNTAHVEMDQFHLATEGILTPESVGARPGNILVPVSNIHSLYHLGNVLDRVKPSRRDVVVLHVRLLRRAASGEYDLEAEQLFGSIEQQLFSQALSIAEKRGKTIRLAVVAANDLWDAILSAATSLQSSTIVLGHSPKEATEEQARHLGDAWEKLGDPKPQFNLEIHMANGDKVYKVLGPHAPNLTANEVNLLHRLWLRFSESAAPLELHHHDVVHFALEEVMKEVEEGQEEAVITRLKAHLQSNVKQKPPSL
ncbi:MAG TPA: APC family permease [Candidatus Sulfotelmatobacter sp.]|jgi:amino acid transporter|nr:APC family permease [Candidatus Sulfotelmatobacter sp.]